MADLHQDKLAMPGVETTDKVLHPDLDPFSQLLGMRLVDLKPGIGTVEMTVGPEHMNPHGTPHGGAIFSLADSALAVASNSRGLEAVALDVSITYCRPALNGSVLRATASELNVTRRTGLFDIRVEREDGKLVASARGTVFYTGNPFKGWDSPQK
ncbi:hydroxyphenylacetyl-CoA thioesterase PaaI [Alicyclobacillus ferrooxydans]|nr:hydroxyphenylacetyl-CoA thioesterase PaaI [Alicyclobacillus ferrooxydans]